MRLVEARIEGFGQYRDQVISFASGLNIIHGTNESGKTTLMKFIQKAYSTGFTSHRSAANIQKTMKSTGHGTEDPTRVL